ncbi:MAG: hypothetical protein R2769_07090 [Saprospiraceae bacterium]
MSDGFSHLDEKGRPSMVNVGEKPITKRSATARALMYLGAGVIQKLEGDNWISPKGQFLNGSHRRSYGCEKDR